VFVARLGETALAASSLGIAVFGLTMWGISGLTGACAPLIAAELGRRSHAVREVRRSVRMALWLSVLVGGLGMGLCLLGERLMLATGQDPRTSAMAGQFLGIVAWAMIPMIAASVLRTFVAALGRPIYSTAITLLAIAVNAFGNWVLVFGNLGAPALGLEGSALSSVLTALAIFMGMDIRTVGDMGELPDSLPVFLLPDVPLNWETLAIIFPVSATLAVVGLLESMMTASIVDDLTDTPSNKNRECVGQGVANIASGCLGGMAGCAMIGQSVINVKSGGRGRLSTLAAGVFLLLMIVFIGDWVAQIPMAALVAVMIMVSIGTFNWASIRDLRSHPLS